MSGVRGEPATKGNDVTTASNGELEAGAQSAPRQYDPSVSSPVSEASRPGTAEQRWTSGATGFVRNLRDVTLISTVYLFFAGFTYRYFLNVHSGIPADLGLARFEAVLVYAVSALVGFTIWNVLLYILFLSVIVIWTWAVLIPHRFDTLRPLAPIAATCTAVIIFPIIFLAAYANSQIASEGVATLIRPGSIAIRADAIHKYGILATIQGKRRQISPLLAAVNNDQAYIIHETDREMFILVKPPDAAPLVYIIPRSDIDHVKKVLAR